MPSPPGQTAHRGGPRELAATLLATVASHFAQPKRIVTKYLGAYK
jgi:hypothetical protein